MEVWSDTVLPGVPVVLATDEKMSTTDEPAARVDSVQVRVPSELPGGTEDTTVPEGGGGTTPVKVRAALRLSAVIRLKAVLAPSFSSVILYWTVSPITTDGSGDVVKLPPEVASLCSFNAVI